MTLEGKVALLRARRVASGWALPARFAGAGASIMMNGFGDADEIETLRAQLCEEFGVSVAFDGADLSRRDEVSRLVGETIDVLAVSTLVNKRRHSIRRADRGVSRRTLGGDHRAQSLGRSIR